MRKGWSTQNSSPGCVKPIYGAQYPPLTNNESSLGSNSTKIDKFRDYENSVSDVWDIGSLLDDNLAVLSAYKVLQRHASENDPNYIAALPNREDPNAIMPNCKPVPSKGAADKAMQRLATQREVSICNIQQTNHPTHPQSNSIGIYPKLPELIIKTSQSSSNYSTKARKSPTISNSPKGILSSDLSRFDRLRRSLGILQESATLPGSGTVVDLIELRKECWLGIPQRIRPLAWRVLSGYAPTNMDRIDQTLKRKRDEYWHSVEQYFHTRYDEQHQNTFRQIHIDIPRMCPLIPLFQQKLVQEIFERILYIWAIRHPASGYVQGINDLLTPFFVVFLSEHLDQDVEVSTFDVSLLGRLQIEMVEADSFWCVSALLDTIQDNYTFAQPGIQRKVNRLEELVSRVDRPLFNHLMENSVEFLQFAFRWMNNLLMREIPLRATIRLWDTYLSELNGFSEFHTYVCGAFLRLWSKQLQNEKDFQGIMLLLQSLPTQSWADQQICELTADAYSLMQVFHGTKSHLSQPSS